MYLNSPIHNVLYDIELQDIINQHKWTIGQKGYVLHTTIYISLHRFIWQHVNGDIPNNRIIDHKNGNKLDNRLSNLRCVTYRQNAHNKTGHRNKSYSSNYVGVTYHKRYNKFHASITINGKKHHLGYFDCEYSAHCAYQRKLASITQDELKPVASFNGQYKDYDFSDFIKSLE